MSALAANRRRASQEIRPDRVTPLLILEISEIPWSIIDQLVRDERFQNLKTFFENCRTYTAVNDTGDFSPMVTWPTFYRGSFNGKALWDEFLERRQSIGICGTLQSWPPRNPGYGGFYIPDMYADDAKCIPASVEPYQEYCLARANGGAPQRWSKWFRLFFSLPRIGIRFRTMGKLIAQFYREWVDKALFGSRRQVLQNVLMWDVFSKLFDPRDPPALSTFYTDIVEGSMNRGNDSFEFAMLELNRVVGETMRFTKTNPRLRIVFASSMGVLAVYTPHAHGVDTREPISTSSVKAFLMELAGL